MRQGNLKDHNTFEVGIWMRVSTEDQAKARVPLITNAAHAYAEAKGPILRRAS
jgi:hypothetical protein